jgi:hypothetical protein
MSKTPFKKRPKKTHLTFKSKFESAVYKIAGNFFETAAFNHSLTKGEEREVPFINFFTQNLPKTFSIVKGEIVDLNGESSPQLDVMIYDSSRNIPFYSGDNCILPAESLLASIEVKSKLTQEEIRKILINTKKLKALKPFGNNLDVSKQRRDVEDKVKCRYFHAVFAYDTDLSAKDWATNEFERIVRVAKEEKIDYTLLDRVIVLNKGLINPTYSIAKESADNADMFLHYYMDLLNYLQRENTRRQTVPYLEYAGKLSKDWIKL